jgi:hypothetical protein
MSALCGQGTHLVTLQLFLSVRTHHVWRYFSQVTTAVLVDGCPSSVRTEQFEVLRPKTCSPAGAVTPICKNRNVCVCVCVAEERTKIQL